MTISLPARVYLILIAILCAFTASSWATGSECSCAVVAQSCGDESADGLRHLRSKRPQCTQSELAACGARYQLSLKGFPAAAYNIEAQQFIRALETSADDLMALYPGRVTPREYSELAALAVGILGNESGFYLSRKFKLKRMAPDWVVDSVKCRLHNVCEEVRSHGPTQLKAIPKKIAETFKVTLQSVWSNPQHAALATMGFLIELKREMYSYRRYYGNSALAGLDQDTYLDYLPYFYQGKGSRILLKNEMPNSADRGRNAYLYHARRTMDALKITEYTCPNLQMTSQPDSAAQR